MIDSRRPDQSCTDIDPRPPGDPVMTLAFRWHLFVVAFLALCSPPPAGAQSARRPNVVVILADDQGWGDLSCHGNRNLSTPNIDSLGRDGAMFSRFFVCPVCSPTRAEFLTGRYHWRGGVRNVSTGGERLDLDERTIADDFRAAGYTTGLFGKWHNGTQFPYHPLGRGFDEFYGFTSGHWGDYFSPPLDHNGELTQGKGYLTDDLTQHAIEFIDSSRSKPFFCYLALNTPHSPMQVPDEYWNKARDRPITQRGRMGDGEDISMTRAALAMVENIDANVGRVLKHLDDRNLSRETIVLYFSDNGPNSPRWNDGMRGQKGSTDEGGVRSPLLIRWPGQIAAGTRIQHIAGAIDLLPTLLNLAGIFRSEGPPLDGVSQHEVLRGKDGPSGDRTILSHWAGKVSARTNYFRLDAQGRLYDMRVDPGQSIDVSEKFPEIARPLREAAEQCQAEIRRDLTPDDRPFLVGGRPRVLTQLPARDGRSSGNVRRSANAPNCSYFTNWTSPDDRIFWEVEVVEAGTYFVEVLYACPEADLGSELALSFTQGDKAVTSLTARVRDPHDPPARGDENDRVPRKGESLVKDFRPWSLGRLTLPTGRGKLELKAIAIPGKQVIEVRGLLLRPE